MAMTLPRNVSALINAYAKPITRPDWRTCKDDNIMDIFDELMENKVFNHYFNMTHNIEEYNYYGRVIRQGRRFKGYLPTRWD
jgi:hypothetical protein